MDFGTIFLKNAMSIMRAAASPLKRIYEENQAARGGRTVKVDALGKQFEISYGHLIHSRSGQEGFSPIAANAIQEIISTSQLQSAEMQIWLNKPEVKKNFFALAEAYLVNPNGYIRNKKKAFNALKKSFPDTALQEGEKFEDVARKICSVLTSGPVANLNSGDQVLLGAAQHNVSAVENVQETLDTHLDTKSAAQVYHDKLAREQLQYIVLTRGVPGANEKEDISRLADKVSDTGDLKHCSSDTKSDVLFWAARIHAAKGKDATQKAREFLGKLLKIKPDYDTRTINAFLLNSESKKDEAIKLLNEINTPDSRTILNSILSTKGRMEWYRQNKGQYQNQELFTGRGWANLVVSFIEQEAWDEGYEIIPTIPSNAFQDACDLNYVLGLIYTASLLPMDIRKAVLVGGGFCPDLPIATDNDSKQAWAKAIEHLEKAQATFEELKLEGRALFAKCWLSWLYYKNTDTREKGLQIIQAGLSNPEDAYQFLQIAITNDIPFDIEEQERWIKNKEITGTLKGEDFVARLFLLRRKKDFQGMIQFLDENKNMLVPDFLDETMWAFNKIDALVELGTADGFSQAENLLFEYKNDFGDDFAQIHDKIRAAKGEDIQESLINRYEAEKQDIDLINLCRALYRQKDFSLLEKYSQELFNRHKTTENAGLYVIALWHLEKYKKLTDFASSHISEISDDARLMSHYAWSLYYTGKFKEALELCNKHFNNQADSDIASLKINLALFAGDWEKFPELLNIEKQEAQNRNPIHLLQTAPILADYDLDEAMNFLKLAVSKEPNNPKILINAYSLATQFGREEEASEWFKSALELQTDESLIKSVPLEDIIEHKNKWQERQSYVSGQLEKAECSYSILCDCLNRPLSSIYITQANYNKRQTDTRNRTPILSRHGGRNIIPLDDIGTVTIDVGSLYILSTLGMLDSFFDRFSKIVISWHSMACFLTDIRASKFHQPSRIRDAKILRRLVEDKKLLLIDRQSNLSPPKWLIEEVGDDSAILLEAAKQNNGLVVMSRPIFKVSSFMKKLADLKEYEPYIISSKKFSEFLNTQGVLDQNVHQRAQDYLSLHDRIPDGINEIDVQQGQNIYFSDLALSHYSACGVLQHIRPTGFTAYCHADALQEALSLIKTEDLAQEVMNQIHAIRKRLNSAYNEGKVEFLSRTKNEKELDHAYSATTTNIFGNEKSSDAVWIDDRFINQHGSATHANKEVSPIIGVLDFLYDQKKREKITAEQLWRALETLRSQGHVLIPVSIEELRFQLDDCYDRKTHKIDEKFGLRSLRDNILQLQATDILRSRTEAPFLGALQQATIVTIYKLWGDAEIDLKEAEIKSKWVLDNIFPTLFEWKHIAESRPEEQWQENLAELYGLLIKPFCGNLERQKSFARWLNDNVLKSISYKNYRAIERMKEIIKDSYKEFFDDPKN